MNMSHSSEMNQNARTGSHARPANKRRATICSLADSGSITKASRTVSMNGAVVDGTAQANFTEAMQELKHMSRSGMRLTRGNGAVGAV